MNFRFTKWKVLGSLIIWFVGNFVFGLYISTMCTGDIGCTAPVSIDGVWWVLQSPFSWLSLVVIYVIWSLIQKKTINPNI